MKKAMWLETDIRYREVEFAFLGISLGVEFNKNYLILLCFYKKLCPSPHKIVQLEPNVKTFSLA